MSGTAEASLTPEEQWRLACYAIRQAATAPPLSDEAKERVRQALRPSPIAV